MKNINIKELLKSRIVWNVIILILFAAFIYVLISIYFVNHFFFNTKINGVDVSLKAHDDACNVIRDSINGYELQLIERHGQSEEISGQSIGMQYNEQNSISEIYDSRNPFRWINSLFKEQKYYVNNLFIYNIYELESRIRGLNCLNGGIVEPRNADFRYTNGSYELVEEEYGNKILKEKLYEAIILSISKGELKLDLNEKLCYENPKYTINSDKARKTKDLLNMYAAAKICYRFGGENEVLDGDIINKWLSVDENLDVVISKKAVMKYVYELSKKYDTVGITRNFKASTGKIVEVKGGIYGWKIDQDTETVAIMRDIVLGKTVEREPIYAQRALLRGKNEIGDTYVEINITRQQLWFYKAGKLITQGPIVTGNPNRGNSTVTGLYMLNYKQKSATLRGTGYSSEVTYWMPFFGNTGIHDATWRYSFGGQIYKRDGTHGCVNVPVYLAKVLFENICEGTPIVCYEE